MLESRGKACKEVVDVKEYRAGLSLFKIDFALYRVVSSWL